jgi:hypothetical protein
MSKNDEFDLRELLGDPGEPDSRRPAIQDTPASELPLPTKPAPEEERPEVAWVKTYTGVPHGQQEQLSHPQPEPPKISIEDLDSPLLLSPDYKDEAGELDDEYRLTFAATIEEVKDLEPEALQALRHRLDRMIRRAKIQQRAIRVTEEGKLQLIDEKRRKAIRVKDSEFMSGHRKASVASEPKEKKVKSPKADVGLSQVEKQVKQFVKLMMSDEVIRTTLAAVGTAIPENLTELIARYRK